MRPKEYRTSLFAPTMVSLLSLCICGSLTRSLAQEVGPSERGGRDVQEGGGSRGVEMLTPGTSSQLEGSLTLGFKAPARGLPGRREGAGTRGPCPRGNKSLTALMPATNLGQTLSAYPTFFFYMPATRSQKAEFELLDDSNKSVYKTSFNITGSSGVVSISLPKTATLSPLTVGKDYKWQFVITCEPDNPSDDLLVEGWVQRIEANPTLVQQLEKASKRDRVLVYAEAGLWYETLSALADLRNAEPNNTDFATDWTNLLLSVGLDKIAAEPLLGKLAK